MQAALASWHDHHVAMSVYLQLNSQSSCQCTMQKEQATEMPLYCHRGTQQQMVASLPRLVFGPSNVATSAAFCQLPKSSSWQHVTELTRIVTDGAGNGSEGTGIGFNSQTLLAWRPCCLLLNYLCYHCDKRSILLRWGESDCASSFQTTMAL